MAEHVVRGSEKTLSGELGVWAEQWWGWWRRRSFSAGLRPWTLRDRQQRAPKEL